MEHLFPGLEPPKRTDEEKKKSLSQIQQATKKRRRLDWQFYATVVSAIAVLFVFIASLSKDSTFTPSPYNLSSDATIENIVMYNHNVDLRDQPLTHLNKWYYFGEYNLNERQIEQVKPFVERAIHAQERTELQSVPVLQMMIVTMSDGTEHILSFHHNEKVIYNWGTENTVPFTMEEYFDMVFDIEMNLDKNLSGLIKLLILFGLYSLYAVILREVSPNRVLADEQVEIGKTLTYGFVFFVLLFTVLEYSIQLFGGYNLLFIVSFFTIGFILISIYYRVNKLPRSYWEIPISVIFFTLFTIIFAL
jgi:hypothetical protein